MVTKPTNQPDRYDPDRVATLGPVKRTIEQLRLPLKRRRKVLSILNALEMQIEDGGDSSAVNQHLLGALREAIIHQVGPDKAAPGICAGVS